MSADSTAKWQRCIIGSIWWNNICLSVAVWALTSQSSVFTAIDMLSRDSRDWSGGDFDNNKIRKSGLFVATVIISIGACLALIAGVINIVASCNGKIKLLIIYAALVGGTIIANLSGGSLALSYRSETERTLLKRAAIMQRDKYIPLPMALGENASTSNAKLSMEMNVIQVHYQCCGLKDYKDYEDIAVLWKNSRTNYRTNGTNSKPLNYPVTCCPLKSGVFNSWNRYYDYLETADCPNTGFGLNIKGCYDSMWSKIDGLTLGLMIPAFILGILEIACLVAAIGLVRNASVRVKI